MSTVIERGEKHMRGTGAGLLPASQHYYELGHMNGTEFAATITPEQVEAGARAHWKAVYGIEPPEIRQQAGRGTLDGYNASLWNDIVRGLTAALRAMGFEVAS